MIDSEHGPLMKKRSIAVAFQGALGAFSHRAAQQLFSEEVEVKPCQTFGEIFEAVSESSASHGVIPIENTLHGSIHENYDNLLRYDLAIFGETTVRIAHNLIAPPGVRLQSLKRVYSHPVALNQCRIFLGKHKRLEPVSYYDTAGSVEMIMKDRPPHAAAIASETAAKIYGASIVKRNVEDNSQNFTRFFLIGKRDSRPREPRSENGTWKTSLVFAVKNSPGTLFRAMACFALRDINLTKIESRPNREKPWEYMFYVDIMGRSSETSVQRALTQLEEISSFSRILGSYCPQNH
jgi:prephenate dehydratase